MKIKIALIPAAALCVVAVIAFLLWPTNSADARQTTGANIAVLSETPISMSIQFTDAQNNSETYSFTRGGAAEPWRHGGSGALLGVRLGKSDVRFASMRFLQSRQIDPKLAVVSLSSDIANEPFEDITIIQMYGNELAIALWNHGKITHIEWAGEMWSSLTPCDGADCEVLSAQCCGGMVPPCQPGGNMEGANTNVCQMLLASNCTFEQKEDGCECLQDICLNCNDDPMDGDAEACFIHDTQCPPGSGNPGPTIEDLLQWILDVLEEIQEWLENNPGEVVAGQPCG